MLEERNQERIPGRLRMREKNRNMATRKFDLILSRLRKIHTKKPDLILQRLGTIYKPLRTTLHNSSSRYSASRG